MYQIICIQSRLLQEWYNDRLLELFRDCTCCKRDNNSSYQRYQIIQTLFHEGSWNRDQRATLAWGSNNQFTDLLLRDRIKMRQHGAIIHSKGGRLTREIVEILTLIAYFAIKESVNGQA